MKAIGGIFGRSPFGPLHEHMAKAHECVGCLPACVNSFLEQDWLECRRHGKRISRIEHEADVIKQTLRSNLSNSIFSSVERSEILTMLKNQDRVSDRCEDVANLLMMRSRPFPEALHELLRNLVDSVTSTVNEVTAITRELHRIHEDSGSREETKHILVQVERVGEIEHESDVLEDRLRETLFEHEDEIDPVTILITLDIIRMTGAISDSAENVADYTRAWIETR